MNISLNGTIKADFKQVHEAIDELVGFCEKYNIDGHLSLGIYRKDSKWSE